LCTVFLPLIGSFPSISAAGSLVAHTNASRRTPIRSRTFTSVATKLRARRRHAAWAHRGTRWRVWATRRPTGDAVWLSKNTIGWAVRRHTALRLSARPTARRSEHRWLSGRHRTPWQPRLWTPRPGATCT